MAAMAQFGKNVFRGEYLSVLRRPFLYGLSSQRKCSQLTGVFLDDRAHIKVSGNDAVDFLNGLVTNDINLFYRDTQMSVLYCMMLNVKGRVLYDLFVYKLKEKMDSPEFLLECDRSALKNIVKTFKLYKLRSSVEFTDASDSFASWSVIQEQALESLEKKSSDSSYPLIAVKDPRLSVLGARLVLPKTDLPSQYYSNVEDIMNKSVYTLHRVCHGVSEGVKDIEPGTALPLEYNITELHGVSYQKGCYIGQELTARAHHTGVIRKRIMPVKLNMDNNKITERNFDKDASIKTSDGKAAGKLKSTYGNIGLGLMRLATVKSAESLSVIMSDGTSVSVMADWPSWWSSE